MSRPSQQTEQLVPPPRPRGLPASLLFTAWLLLVVPAIPLLSLYPAGGILLLALALLALEGAALAWFGARERKAERHVTLSAEAPFIQWREAAASRTRPDPR